MGYVYVVGSPEGPNKIGQTLSPAERMGTLQISNAHRLHHRLFACGTADNSLTLERAAHVEMRAHRKRGEWFEVKMDDAVSTLLRLSVELGIPFAEVASDAAPEVRMKLTPKPRRRVMVSGLIEPGMRMALDRLAEGANVTVSLLLNIVLDEWLTSNGLLPEHSAWPESRAIREAVERQKKPN